MEKKRNKYYKAYRNAKLKRKVVDFDIEKDNHLIRYLEGKNFQQYVKSKIKEDIKNDCINK